MLILSRKVNEKIMIGEDISISIIEIKGDQIRIGVDAPRSVKIFRQEVFSEIKAANKAASETGTALPDLPNLAALRKKPHEA
ncbi:MAG: carbon storage regulator CsrA [Treponema sp.]|jgi:carbon storage regulator|nr:carbon storage regulator CsrA [Treponema sp.]